MDQFPGSFIIPDIRSATASSPKVYRFTGMTFLINLADSDFRLGLANIPVSCNGKQEAHPWKFKWSLEQELFTSHPNSRRYSFTLTGYQLGGYKYDKSYCEISIKRVHTGEILLEGRQDLFGPRYNQLQFSRSFEVQGYILPNTPTDDFRCSEVHITWKSYDIETLHTSSCTSSQRSMKQMLDRGILTDVVIKTDGKHFPCHKVVLASASVYFDKMFDVDMKEKNKSLINWNHVVDPDTVQDLLHYIYTEQTPPNIGQTCLTLLEIANMCLMVGLKTLCADHLKKTIDVDNVGVVLRAAVRNDCVDLQKFAVNFIVHNYSLGDGDSPTPWDSLEPEVTKVLVATMLKTMITKKISI